ncbi:protein-disulfide reductase DsbD domain-containing protein [Microvirga sp. 2YAF29]|uniref:protein-disulfide reductase DsbD domain-containing protein n=1 Tax=Microvirga sp. 2YAF29 TaxID=3233031 RepID=UPI003F9D7B22
MAIMFRTISAAFFLILTVFSAAAQSLSSPSGAKGFHSQVRLLSGGKQGYVWLAGIEFTLDQGFKTYWRNPGESGLPPRFDWSGSENAASIEIQWPAPKRHEDAAGVAYVYGRKVILPVLVKPEQAGKPIKLALAVDYGICKDICIPANAELSLPLAEDGPDRAAIEPFQARVPAPRPLGASGDLAVAAVTAKDQADKSVLAIKVRVPAGTKPSLFAEGPENWYLSTSTPDADNNFTVTVEEKPKDAAPALLRLTLVAGDKAIETEVSLDGNGKPR